MYDMRGEKEDDGFVGGYAERIFEYIYTPYKDTLLYTIYYNHFAL